MMGSTLKRSKLLLLTLLLAFAGGNVAWADNADFEEELPEGWEAVGTMNYYEDRAKTGNFSIGNSSNSGWDTNRGNYLKTTKLQGDITLWMRSYKSNTRGYVALYELSDDGETVGNKLASFSSTSITFTQCSHTLAEPTRLAIVINYSHLDNMTYTPFVQTEGKALSVKLDGRTLTTGDSYDFGLTGAGATVPLTLLNTGTEPVSVTAEATGGFTATPASATIGGGTSQTLTVTMAPQTAAGTVTVRAEGLDNFVLNVSGTVRDPDKLFVDFADGLLPDDWQATYFTVEQGYAYCKQTITRGTLTTPSLTFDEGERFYFNAMAYSVSAVNLPEVTVKTSTDGETWSDAIATFGEEQIATDQWTTLSVTIPSANVKYVRLECLYVKLTNLYGGELPMVAKMAVTATDLNFGMTEASVTKTYTIANKGRAALTGITAISTNAAFAIEAPATVAPYSEETLTVTMSADAKGLQKATITVRAEGQDDQRFDVEGYVIDETKMLVGFDDNQLPAGWTTNGWTFANGVATGAWKSPKPQLVSPKLIVGEGEAMAIRAHKRSGAYGSCTMPIYVKKGNADFALLQEETLDDDYRIYFIEGLAPGNDYTLRFDGNDSEIDLINGFAVNENAPVLAVTDAGGNVLADNATVSFGKELERTFNVSNAGTGTLNVLLEATGDFAADKQELTLGAGQGETVTMTMTELPYGPKSGTLRLVTDNGELTLSLHGTTVDPEAFYVTFDDYQPAEGWTTTGKWYYSSSAANHYDRDNHGYLTSPLMKVVEGAKLQFDAKNDWNTNYLKVQYSEDQTVWTDTPEGELTLTDDYAPYEATIPVGYYYVRFEAQDVYIDNITGLKRCTEVVNAVKGITAGDGSKPWYNLQGQRVSQLRKGQLYVAGGRKIMK